LWRAEPARAPPEDGASPLFGLAPCGVCPARDITAAAVRSYRTFSPLPGLAAVAVCFLWHFPSTGIEPGLPDVIRHTALRSSDFPPLPTPKGRQERPSGPAANMVIIALLQLLIRWPSRGSGSSAKPESLGHVYAGSSR